MDYRDYTGKVWATGGYTVPSMGYTVLSMGYTGKVWATGGYTVLSMGYTGKYGLHRQSNTKHGLHSTKHGLHRQVWATQANYGLHSTKHGLHRQSTGYTVLLKHGQSMAGLQGATQAKYGLHSTKHGLHRQSMDYRSYTGKVWATQYEAWATQACKVWVTGATQAKYGLHSMKHALHRQSNMGYTGKVYGLHRQSMGYTVLSMGYRGLHRLSMGYTGKVIWATQAKYMGYTGKVWATQY